MKNTMMYITVLRKWLTLQCEKNNELVKIVGLVLQ
jgi:hypothetical protein